MREQTLRDEPAHSNRALGEAEDERDGPEEEESVERGERVLRGGRWGRRERRQLLPWEAHGSGEITSLQIAIDFLISISYFL